MFTATLLTIRGGEPRTPPSTFTQLLSSEACSVLLYVHRDCRGGELRTATSTFWLLSSDTWSMLLYVHRDRSDYYGREPRKATSTCTQFLSSDTDTYSVLLYVHRDHNLLGTRSTGRPPRLSEFSQLLGSEACSVLFYVHRDGSDYNGREPRTATSTFTQLLSSDTDI